MKTFGEYIRERRESLNLEVRQRPDGRRFSLRAVALVVGVEPSYLSKVEVGLVPPSRELIRKLADALDEDLDFLMAFAGKVSPDLEAIIKKRPKLFGYLLRELQDAPEDVIHSIVHEVRNRKS